MGYEELCSHIEFGTFPMCNRDLLNNFIMGGSVSVIFRNITLAQILGIGEGKWGDKLGDYYHSPGNR